MNPHTHTHTHTQVNTHTNVHAYVRACIQVEALREENEALRVQNSMLWSLLSPEQGMAGSHPDEDAADGSLDPADGGDSQGEGGGDGMN